MGNNGKLVLRKKVKVKRKTGGRRSTADQVQAQGTGRSVARAFGAKLARRLPYSPCLPSRCWDAFASAHAALPRSVGPYTVVRTTRLINTTSRLVIVGSFAGFHDAHNEKFWTNVCAVEAVPFGDPPSSAGRIGIDDCCKFYSGQPPIPSFTDVAHGSGTCCPAAVSVQILGNMALQSASGQLAAAVCPVRLDLKGSFRTWGNVEQTFLSYMRPRLMSAGKLTLRGIQMDSHPLSMSDVSDFRPMFAPSGPDEVEGSNASPWAINHHNYDPEGWAPMVLYNPSASHVSMLVTTEWRVRFDISNPAVSSHTHHGVTSDTAWEKHIAAATRQLPGVIDIVEKVASTGMNVMSMMKA